MTPKIKGYLKDVAVTYGYQIRSEERLNTLSDKFSMQEGKYGKLYCPCQAKRDEDTICPCKYMREQGACRCGLFEPAARRISNDY